VGIFSSMFGSQDASSNATTNDTKNYDDHSFSSVTNIQTDQGAVQSAMDTVSGSVGSALENLKQVASVAINGAQSGQKSAYDYADNIFSAAVDFANVNNGRTLSAFDRAAVIQNDAMTTLKTAYADSKGTTDAQKQIIFGVLAVAAIFAYAAMRQKAI
jgi:hypothetical protein